MMTTFPSLAHFSANLAMSALDGMLRSTLSNIRQVPNVMSVS